MKCCLNSNLTEVDSMIFLKINRNWKTSRLKYKKDNEKLSVPIPISNEIVSYVVHTLTCRRILLWRTTEDTYKIKVVQRLRIVTWLSLLIYIKMHFDKVKIQHKHKSSDESHRIIVTNFELIWLIWNLASLCSDRNTRILITFDERLLYAIFLFFFSYISHFGQ